MAYSISIYSNNTAVLYDQYKPISACAGDKETVLKFIDESSMNRENIKIYGQHLLKKEKEEQQQ